MILGNSKRIKKILKVLPPAPNSSLSCTHWGTYRLPDPQLCFIAGLSVLNVLKKFKSTLDATQINNFRENVKATITKIVILECSSLFIFSPI